MKNEYENQIYNEQKFKFWLELYSKTEKGHLNEYDSLEWINNEFLEGDYMDDFKLGFSSFLIKSNDNLSEEFDN